MFKAKLCSAALLAVSLSFTLSADAQAQAEAPPAFSGSVTATSTVGNQHHQRIKGIIQTNRQVYYSGDPLEIGIKFPRGADLITDGVVDAYLLIYRPGDVITALPVSDVASANNRKLFQIDAVDIDRLPEGIYQLGLVLTVPDGDPLNLDDWHNGMLGLLTVRGLVVADDSSEGDLDGDGDVDGDGDGDGYVDDDSGDDEAEGDDDQGRGQGRGNNR